MAVNPLDIFVEKSVDYSTHRYYKLMFNTKKLFFKYLQEGRTLEEFKEATNKIWGNVDRRYMEQRIKELEKMIDARALKDNVIKNPTLKPTEIYELVPNERFKEVELQYKNVLDKQYKQRLKTVNKEYVDTDAYLSKMVKDFDKIQAVVPYHYKDGRIAYHNIASYNSMLFNVNLNRSGWNRTIYDGDLLGQDLYYLPAHPFACPMCQAYQGKVYSKSGTHPLYAPMDEAIRGGVGHPNCKHQWLIYWGAEMLQEDIYNDEANAEGYIKKQKIRSLQLERTKLKNNREIYNSLNNGQEVDKTNAKIKKLNSKIKELRH